MTVFSSKEQAEMRSHATRTVLEKTDRILTSRDVDVMIGALGVSSQIPAPAFTDGQRIFIDSGWEPVKTAVNEGFTPSSIAITTALNYHELSHVMFSPRANDPLFKWARERGYHMAFNILEDQKAETRFVKLYEPARHYFTALVTNYMMTDQSLLQSNYVLVSGRLFLPERFRRAFRDNFEKPKLLDDIDRLVSEYKSTDSYGKQQRVIEAFARLLGQLEGGIPKAGSHDQLTKGRQVKGVQEIDKLPEFVDKGDQDEEEEGSEGEGEEDATAGDGSDSEGGKKAKGEDEENSSKEEGDSPSDGEDDGGSGAGTEDAEDKTTAAVEDLLEEIAKETLDDITQDLQEELNDRIEAVRHQEERYAGSAPPSGYRETTTQPKPEYQRIIDRCVDEFRRVQMQHDPGWHHQQRSGKLDPRHYARALRGAETVHKKWREGINDALDFEVVFLLDTSGSMQGGKISEASIALWILKRVFEDCNGTVTVVGFDTSPALLSPRGEVAQTTSIPVYGSGGGTTISPAIDEAHRILGVSRKPLKLCVIITDGDVTDFAAARNRVARLVGPAAVIGIGHDISRWSTGKNIIHTRRITQPIQLVDVVKNLALQLSDERLRTKGSA